MMRTLRLAVALILCVSFASEAAEPAAKSETPPITANAESDPATAGGLKPPPGFRARKRGDVVVYCRKEAPLGSRFPAEKCYDQAGLPELRLAELERTEMLERMRNCLTGSCLAN